MLLRCVSENQRWLFMLILTILCQQLGRLYDGRAAEQFTVVVALPWSEGLGVVRTCRKCCVQTLYNPPFSLRFWDILIAYICLALPG